jgi:hypothetical protein
MLVLMFLPEAELMKELFHAGLSPEVAPSGWHEQARNMMKETLMKHTRGSRRAAIRDGWDDLCAELDEAFVEHFLYTDFALPQPAQSIPGHSDQEHPVASDEVSPPETPQRQQRQSVVPPARGQKRNRNSMIEGNDGQEDTEEDSPSRKRPRIGDVVYVY